MASYKLTNFAVHDLSGIWRYTFEHWSEAQADKNYHEIINTCKKLANNQRRANHILKLKALYWDT